MKISIALATYNGEKYLLEQLNSYISQERLPDELVICDDVSTDKTVSIISDFKKKAPFQVEIIINPINLGYTKNFEKALSLCSGDIIFFSDQDDVWLPNKLKVIENTFLKNKFVSLVIHDAELVNEKLDATDISKLTQIRSGGYGDDSFVTGTLTAIHKNILPIVLPFPDNITGGYDGWVHTISRLIDRREIIEKVLQKLRRHDNNTSQWVVNSLNTVSKIDVLKSQISTKAAISYEDRIYNNYSLNKIFSQYVKDEIILNFSINANKIINNLELEHLSLVKRQKLISKGFIGRKLQAFTMLINNDYKYFNGFKSFLRDIIR